MRPVLLHVVSALIVYLGFTTVAGWLGAFGWLFDLHAHFRLQYFVLALLASLAALRLRRPIVAVIGFSVVSANLCSLMPLYIAPEVVARTDVPPLTLLAYNVEARTKDAPYEDVVAYVRGIDPAIVLIQEATTEWTTAMRALEPRYQVARAVPVDGSTSGMLLLARVPLSFVRLRADIGVPAPAIEFEVEHAGSRYRLLGLHTLPPLKPIYARTRDESIEAAALWAKEQPVRTIVFGDFNVTPWSSGFRPLAAAGLRNSQRGFGYGASWPHRPAWLAPFAIPIDHALTTPDLVATQRTLGPPFRSDHRVLSVSIAPVR